MSHRPGDPTTKNVLSGTARNVVQANVIEGDVHVHSRGRTPVGLPYRAGSFPPRAAAFQGREATNWLHQALQPGGAAVSNSDSVVVSGLGGVGKTRVALG